MPKYLQDHPTSEVLSRGQRWVHLKRHLRLRATAAALHKARARRQALRALETDSRTAQAQYEANPADAASLLAWRQAHHLLQQLNAAASYAAAVQAGVVWQHYGEQSTFWFYRLAREPQAQGWESHRAVRAHSHNQLFLWSRGNLSNPCQSIHHACPPSVERYNS